jgi:cell division protein FtsI (penicillin-binding protein 3)
MRVVPAAGRARILFLGVVAFLWLGAILARLIDLQVVRHGELSARAQRQQQRTLEVTPKRGVLYDRNRHELAVSVSVDSVFAVPNEVKDPERAARLLAPVLAVDATTLEDRLRSSRSFVWLKRKLTAAEADRVRRLGLAGVYFQPEHKRFIPSASWPLTFWASSVWMKTAGGAGAGAGFRHPGRSRRLVISADGRRRWFDRVGDVPTEGASVVLTLDENIQYIAERELAAVIQKTRASSGTIIVQDPRSGEILALANYPTFNPNNPSAVPQQNHVNRALSFVYEPGSTFKLVTIGAALEEGAANPSEVIDCQQGAIYIAGHRIRDHKPFGLLSLREVIYQSSDVGAIKVGLRLGDDKMYEHIRRWRFGRATGIELPAESPGLVRPASNWSRISIGAISMGQEVAITSLQLTAAMSAIASGGVWKQPHVVREISRGNEAEPIPPMPEERIIDSRVAEELRRMLAGVVREGTGRTAQPQGYSAGGKTGTAQKIDASGRYSHTDFVASFSGFAPLEDPVVTVTVVLDSPAVSTTVAKWRRRSSARWSSACSPIATSPRPPVRAPAAPLRLERAAISDFAPTNSTAPA